MLFLCCSPCPLFVPVLLSLFVCSPAKAPTWASVPFGVFICLSQFTAPRAPQHTAQGTTIDADNMEDHMSRSLTVCVVVCLHSDRLRCRAPSHGRAHFLRQIDCAGQMDS
jgi:hypothetical protein